MYALLNYRKSWFSKRRSWFVSINWPLNFGDSRLDNPRFAKIELPAFWVGGTVVVAWKPVDAGLAGSAVLPTASLVSSIFEQWGISKLVFVDEQGNSTSHIRS